MRLCRTARHHLTQTTGAKPRSGKGDSARPNYGQVVAFCVLGALGLAYAHADLGRDSPYYAVLLPRELPLAAALTDLDRAGIRSLRALSFGHGLVVESTAPDFRSRAQALGAWMIIPLSESSACATLDARDA